MCAALWSADGHGAPAVWDWRDIGPPWHASQGSWRADFDRRTLETAPTARGKSVYRSRRFSDRTPVKEDNALKL